MQEKETKRKSTSTALGLWFLCLPKLEANYSFLNLSIKPPRNK
jgi:hypothetical protein